MTMLAADYVCDITVNCETCDVIGARSGVGTLIVQQLTRKHRDCKVTIDVTNVRRKRVPRRWAW